MAAGGMNPAAARRARPCGPPAMHGEPGRGGPCLSRGRVCRRPSRTPCFDRADLRRGAGRVSFRVCRHLAGDGLAAGGRRHVGAAFRGRACRDPCDAAPRRQRAGRRDRAGRLGHGWRAFFFGLAMQVPPACGSGRLVNAGSGNPLSLLALPFVAVGSFPGGARHLLLAGGAGRFLRDQA